MNRLTLILGGLLTCISFTACSQKATLRIFDKPITWNAEREWTAIPTIEVTFDVFNPITLGGRADLTGASNLNVSSQFLIDRDGTIFRLLPETTFARHVIGLNYLAIGIENIGSDNMPLTKAQLEANEKLIRYLKRKYPIDYVIGHHEYQRFQKTELWKETDPNYRTVKSDPGDAFMIRLRKKLTDINLKPLPTL